jgi:hypothetical protein
MSEKKTLELQLRMEKNSADNYTQRAQAAQEKSRKKPLDSELKEEASSLQIDADNATRKMNQLNEK